MLPYLEILLCSIIWGSAGPLIRASGLSTPSVVTIRFVLPLLLSFLALRIVEKKQPKQMSSTMLKVSILNPIGNFLYIAGFAFTSISNVVLLIYTRPVLATLLSAIILGERISARLWLLLLVSFSGVVIIVTGHPLSLANRDLIGMAIAFLAAFTTALTWAMIKKRGYGDNSPIEILFYQHLIGGAACLFYLPKVVISEPLSGLFVASLYGIFVGFVATLLYFRGLRAVPLSQAMPLTYMELVITVVIAVFVFGEELTSRTIFGGMLIVSSALATIFMAQKEKALLT